MIITAKLLAHPIGDHRTNGQALVTHHFSQAIERRRFHLEIADPPALIVESFDLAVVLGIGKLHPKRPPLRSVKSRGGGGNALEVAFPESLKEFLGAFHHVWHRKILGIIHLFDEGVAHGYFIYLTVLFIKIN